MIYRASKKRYEFMQYKNSGSSGLKLPLISLGLWHNFGGKKINSESKKVLFKAFDSGITHFDLANNYGPPYGSAEINFGKILKNDLSKYRDELIISSKAGYDMWEGPYGEWGSKKHIIASCNQSLQRMGLDYVDIFYSHRFDPNTPLEETADALEYIYKSGKALPDL
jgi:L-glyceraldehyde 3-phosphate reductase